MSHEASVDQSLDGHLQRNTLLGPPELSIYVRLDLSGPLGTGHVSITTFSDPETVESVYTMSTPVPLSEVRASAIDMLTIELERMLLRLSPF
jgi:hypothetical protein